MEHMELRITEEDACEAAPDWWIDCKEKTDIRHHRKLDGSFCKRPPSCKATYTTMETYGIEKRYSCKQNKMRRNTSTEVLHALTDAEPWPTTHKADDVPTDETGWW